ncbi:hypothetical protein D3C80_1560670 [compost metagenome]
MRRDSILRVAGGWPGREQGRRCDRRIVVVLGADQPLLVLAGGVHHFHVRRPAGMAWPVAHGDSVVPAVCVCGGGVSAATVQGRCVWHQRGDLPATVFRGGDDWPGKGWRVEAIAQGDWPAGIRGDIADAAVCGSGGS